MNLIFFKKYDHSWNFDFDLHIIIILFFLKNINYKNF